MSRRWLTAVGLAIVAVAASACTVRDAASAKHLLFGSAAQSHTIAVDEEYAAVLAREFSMLVPENELKWDTTESTQGTFDFGAADRLVAFATAHHMKVRGAPLLWWFQNPSWLRNTSWT